MSSGSLERNEAARGEIGIGGFGVGMLTDLGAEDGTACSLAVEAKHLHVWFG